MTEKKKKIQNACKVIRKELLIHGFLYDAFAASIESAIKEHDGENIRGLFEHILNRITGED